MRRLISPEVSQRALALYNAGAPLRDISIATGFTAAALSRLFKRIGAAPRRTGPPPKRGSRLSSEEEQRLVALYTSRECSLNEVARLFSITAGAARATLRRAGCAVRRMWSLRRTASGEVVCIDCGVVLTDQNSILDKHRATKRISRCNACQLAYIRYKKYGLSSEALLGRLEQQSHQCGICRVSLTIASLVVDHCHTLGHVRGLLCDGCNHALGLTQDSAETLRRAALYLESADTGLVVRPAGVYTTVGTTADKHRYYTYGVTPDQYQALVAQQSGTCAICHRLRTTRQAPSLVVEHCHHTLRIRGLTCQFCNLVLSAFRDNPALCRAAADYLERSANAPH